MKTNTLKKRLKAVLVSIGIMAGAIFSTHALADGSLDTKTNGQFIYQSQSINHGIFSYLNRIGGKLSIRPKLIYVSTANGRAIYSYRHAGSEKTTPWNVHYVDTAYGRAIYSYDTPRLNGKVMLQPIQVLH